MVERLVDVDELRAAPETFATALDQLGPALFVEPPAPGEWSPAEVLLHVRAADAVIAPRVLQVLARPGVALPDLDERAVGALLDRAALSPIEQIASFRARRRDLVALLSTLTDHERSLTGVHEIRGTVTVDDICRALVDHEREHLAQLATAVHALSTTPR